MQRRKFVVGLGSLAAGASAAVGTGALSKMNAPRGMVGRVAPDAPSAYVQMKPDSFNGDHARVLGNGELQLYFGSISNQGDGLNVESENWFDQVFRVDLKDVDSGRSKGDYDLWFTKNPNLNNPQDLRFYWDSQQSRTINSSNKIDIKNTGTPVGVYIDLMGSGLSAGDSIADHFGPAISNAFTVHIEHNP